MRASVVSRRVAAGSFVADSRALLNLTAKTETELVPRSVSGRSHPVDQPLDPLVVGTERVLAEHGPLRLVVELEVHPVDGEVAPALLRAPDELSTQPGASVLGRHGLGLEDLEVGGDPGDRPAPL